MYNALWIVFSLVKECCNLTSCGFPPKDLEDLSLTMITID